MDVDLVLNVELTNMGGVAKHFDEIATKGEYMLSIFVSVLGHLATFATLLALYLTVLPPGSARPEWHWPSIVAVSLVMMLTMLMDVRRQCLSRPRKYNTERQIRSYMSQWLRSGGRAVSLSRDLSWVDRDNEQILIEKSKKGELVLCVERPTKLTERLTRAGAKIYFYEHLDYIPKSRFTIVDFERDGARVAVGASNGSSHVIQEFRVGHHPLFATAEDLVNVIMRSARPKL